MKHLRFRANATKVRRPFSVKEPALAAYPLDRKRLDVAEKSRSNLFNWRGQFTPQFVEYILTEFSSSGDVVLDPFCGSGTVLKESSSKGLECHGFEINPAAYAMSRFFTFAGLSEAERRELVRVVDDILRGLLLGYDDFPLAVSSEDFRQRFSGLLSFGEALLSACATRQHRLLSLLVLFGAEGSRATSLATAVRTSFANLRQNLLALPFSNARVTASLADARSCNRSLRGKVSLVLTSPPYVNVFNYHQNHRAILELLGFDILKIAKSEIGSNRKNRGNRFRTVVQYCLDLEQALSAIADCLRPGGVLVIVLGRESRVRGVPFFNSHIVRELLEGVTSFSWIRSEERSFTNRFGATIKEDLLIAQRNNSPPVLSRGCSIPVKHLLVGMDASLSEEVRQEIQEAVQAAASVQPSPIFHSRGVF